MADQKTIEKLNKMKETLETAKSSADRATGALQQLEASLKTEFDVDNLEDAERLLRRLERDERIMKDEIEEAVTKLEADYVWS